MFQGRDYELYETMMRPYATRLALDLEPDAIGPEWVPYFTSDVVVDSLRQLARDADPVWPHETYFLPSQWAVVARVDGSASVDEIADAVRAERPFTTRSEVITTLWCLHVEGFVLFQSDPAIP
jgi:hypothetical protein